MKIKKTYIPIVIFLAIGAVLEFLSVSLGTYTGLVLFIFYLFIASLLWTNPFAFLSVSIFTLLLEALGLYAGIPFGHYQYGPSLGAPSILGVPLFIPLAWFILISAASQITSKWYLSALLIVFIDIILEIFAVATGLWTWPGHTGPLTAPIQNYLTWGIVASIGYFFIPKNDKLKSASYSIIILLLTYMILVSVIYMLK